MRTSKTSAGVTLIEMLVVLAIIVVVAGIGTPSFQSFLLSQRMTATANDLLGAVNLARSEAIRRGVRVDLVPAGDGTDWDKGWVVFVDQDNDQKPDDDEQIVFTHGPVPSGIHVVSSFTSNTPIDLAYNDTGHTRTNTGSFQSGSFLLQQGQIVGRKLKVNMMGRARICNPSTESNC